MDPAMRPTTTESTSRRCSPSVAVISLSLGPANDDPEDPTTLEIMEIEQRAIAYGNESFDWRQASGWRAAESDEDMDLDTFGRHEDARAWESGWLACCIAHHEAEIDLPPASASASTQRKPLIRRPSAAAIAKLRGRIIAGLTLSQRCRISASTNRANEASRESVRRLVSSRLAAEMRKRGWFAEEGYAPGSWAAP